MTRSGEFDRIARIAEVLARPDLARLGVVQGIGDDAAVLAPPAGAQLVWTVDEQVEGTHFRRVLLAWEEVGWRSFMAAVSDVAAMGATPWCALSALTVPEDVDDVALASLVSGQRDAANAVGAPIVGGNLARGPVVAITTSVLGVAEHPLRRGGARPGDGLWLSGDVGWAAAGFRALERGLERDPTFARGVQAWRRPTARIVEARALRGVARAVIDVSDGLAQDVAHLAAASNVCAVLDAGALLDHVGTALAEAAGRLGVAPLDLALNGGEDYALVAAGEKGPEGFTRIGELREGAGVVLRTKDGERAIAPRGFDHFRSP